jgi:hypothetical protein
MLVIPLVLSDISANTDTICSILAIIPSNVDPATQEILKLAKKADPTMTRTMAVLTKPDLAIEKATQQIAIDHVLGKRGDLTLGYYVVKNRGPDDVDKTLDQGQMDERAFFSTTPWSVLAHTGKAGIDCLRQRVRELLSDLIKKEFPKLKSEVSKELASVRALHAKMGPTRNDQHTQRAYLNRMGEAFQTITRHALNAYYTSDKIFSDRHGLRLITRVVEASEFYANEMLASGHTRPFQTNTDDDTKESEAQGDDKASWGTADEKAVSISKKQGVNFVEIAKKYPELEEIFDSWDCFSGDSKRCSIKEYIEDVYKASRGQDLGTVSRPA